MEGLTFTAQGGKDVASNLSFCEYSSCAKDYADAEYYGNPGICHSGCFEKTTELNAGPTVNSATVSAGNEITAPEAWTWWWNPIPNEILTPPTKTPETLEEVVRRVVHEAFNQLNRDGSPLVTPIIEKYYLKHK